MEVVIDDTGSGGDGIAKIQGYLILLPHSKIEERLSVEILSVGEKFALEERLVN